MPHGEFPRDWPPALEASPDPGASQLAWMADGSGTGVWYNRRWLEFTGAAPEEIQKWGWPKLQHLDHR